VRRARRFVAAPAAQPAEAPMEMAAEVEVIVVVMSPSVRPVATHYFPAGLLTCGSLALDLAFPVSQWPKSSKPRRSQLRGQSRFWPRFGSSSPYSLSRPRALGRKAPERVFRRPWPQSQHPQMTSTRGYDKRPMGDNRI
jgi:hypothetical protein